MSSLVAHIDGSPREYLGASGIGVLVEHANGHRVEIADFVPGADSNYAEYAALLAALEYAAANRCSHLEVFTDSEVVARQLNGEYICRSRALRAIYELCQEWIGRLEFFSITHIRREHNMEANRLANLAALRAEVQDEDQDQDEDARDYDTLN